MPNWAVQDLHIVGRQADVDRFVRTGFRKGRGSADATLDLRRLCPARGRPSADGHGQAVVLLHFRTRTQATFSMITSWDYPRSFYTELARRWPRLAFICSVNEDMGQFGGVIVVRDGRVRDLVSDYDAGYDRRTHAARIKALLREWGIFLTTDREWRVGLLQDLSGRSIPADAHFDDDLWFYFRSPEEAAAFRRRYRTTAMMQRAGKAWRVRRAPASGRPRSR